jgi:hypothetical protein
MVQVHAGGSYESAVIGERFRLGCPPTILARTASVAPIGFTRLRSAGAPLGRTKDMPAENAYLLHVQLQPAAVDMWIDGKHSPATTTTPGTTVFVRPEKQSGCRNPLVVRQCSVLYFPSFLSF